MSRMYKEYFNRRPPELTLVTDSEQEDFFTYRRRVNTLNERRFAFRHPGQSVVSRVVE